MADNLHQCIAAYLVGDLDEEGVHDLERRLAHDPTAARLLAALAAQELDLYAVMAAGVGRRRPRILRWTLAAAVLAAALIIAWFATTPPQLGTLAEVAGTVDLNPGGGWRAAEAGARLRAGMAVRVPSGTSATVRLEDGTSLALRPDSIVRLHGPEPLLVELDEGAVLCAVASRPAGRALVLRTRHADIAVLGTRFAVSCGPQGSRLTVEEGLVRLTRRSDAAAVEVAAGQGLTVADGEAGELRPQPLSAELVIDDADPSTWRSGVWNSSRGPSPWAGGSLYGDREARFAWLAPTLPAGNYEVQAWWTTRGERRAIAAYTVHHADGATRITCDQDDRSLAGRWNSLGEFRFAGDGHARVTLATDTDRTSRLVCADAIRFIPIPDHLQEQP